MILEKNHLDEGFDLLIYHVRRGYACSIISIIETHGRLLVRQKHPRWL